VEYGSAGRRNSDIKLGVATKRSWTDARIEMGRVGRKGRKYYNDGVMGETGADEPRALPSVEVEELGMEWTR